MSDVRISDVDRLVAIEAIKQTKARYYRTMDTKDWDAYAMVFAPDAVMDARGETSDGSGYVEGREQIVAFIKRVIGDVLTVHHGHMPEITITSPTTATAIFAMEDKLRWPDGSPIKTLHGYGHYHETFERIGGEWLIKTTTLKRLRIDVELTNERSVQGS